MVDDKGLPMDGFLRLDDIFNLNLPADLVVLSACQTGLGKEVRGEGLIGLTRGLMYAGAPRVVVSLWSVNDRATAELMKRFYRAMLLDKQRPAAALRSAQLELRNDPDGARPITGPALCYRASGSSGVGIDPDTCSRRDCLAPESDRTL